MSEQAVNNDPVVVFAACFSVSPWEGKRYHCFESRYPSVKSRAHDAMPVKAVNRATSIWRVIISAAGLEVQEVKRRWNGRI